LTPDPEKKKRKKRALTAWQKHVKAEMKKYPGLSFKEVLPKAKLTYKKSPRLVNPVSPAPKKRGVRKMAKKVKRKRAGFTLPMAVIVPLVAGPFVPPGPAGWGTPANAAMAGDWADAARTACVSYTFFDPGKPGVKSEGFKWDGGNAIKMLLIGFLVHWVAGKLGVNRALGRAKVPVARI